MRLRAPRGARVAAVVVGVVLVAAACGGGSDDNAGAGSDDGPDRTTTPAQPTTTRTDPNTAVEQAYRDAKAGYLAALLALDGNHPELLAHTTGDHLAETRLYIAGLEQNRLVVRGTIDVVEATVRSVDAASATVSAAVCDRSFKHDASTGELRDSPDPVRFEETATLVLENGAWKVSRLTGRETGPCT